MAGPPPPNRVVELVDLTLDDDDDDGATNVSSTWPNGVINANHHGSRISSHAPAPSSQYIQSSPPNKRVKLLNGQYASTTAQAVVFPYAQAGAKQAIAEDPSLVEAVLREKVSNPSFCFIIGNRANTRCLAPVGASTSI